MIDILATYQFSGSPTTVLLLKTETGEAPDYHYPSHGRYLFVLQDRGAEDDLAIFDLLSRIISTKPAVVIFQGVHSEFMHDYFDRRLVAAEHFALTLYLGPSSDGLSEPLDLFIYLSDGLALYHDPKIAVPLPGVVFISQLADSKTIASITESLEQASRVLSEP